MKVLLNKDLTKFDRSQFNDFSIFSEPVVHQDSQPQSFSWESFGSNDTLDEILAAEDKKFEDEVIVEDDKELKFETVTIMIRNTSLLINNSIFPLPSTIRSAAILPGIDDNNEDNLIITLSSGYLLLIRLVNNKNLFEPMVFMWHRIFDPSKILPSERLGYNISCHDTGLYFLINAFQDYVAIYKCSQSAITKQTQIDGFRILNISGILLNTDFFKHDGKSGIRFYSFIMNQDKKLQLKAFEWENDSMEKTMDNQNFSSISRSTLPLYDMGIPCLVIPLVKNSNILIITETHLMILNYDKIHSGVTRVEKVSYFGFFPINFYVPKGSIIKNEEKFFEQILISTCDGKLYLVEINENDQINCVLFGYLKNHCLSNFILERIPNLTNEFMITFSDEKTDGYCERVKLDNLTKQLVVMTIYEKYYNWSPMFDFDCVEHIKYKPSYTSQELWLCSGESFNGSIIHMRYGIKAKALNIDSSLKRALNIFPIHYSTEISNDNYYFFVNYSNSSKLYRLEDEEIFEIPIVTTLKKSLTILLETLKDDTLLIQVTEKSITLGDLRSIDFSLEEIDGSIIHAIIVNEYLFYVIMTQNFDYVLNKLKILTNSIEIIKESSIKLQIAPSCLKTFKFAGKDYLIVGADSGTIQILNFNMDLIKNFNFDEFLESVIFDTFIVTDNDLIWLYLTDQLGDLLIVTLSPNDIDEDDDTALLSDGEGEEESFFIQRKKLINFGLLPLKMLKSSCEKNLYLYAKQFWRIPLMNISESLNPMNVFFEGTLTERNIIKLIPLVNNDIAMLRDDGFAISKISPNPGPCPKKFLLKFTPFKFLYISYLHVFCIISNDDNLLNTNQRISFFDTKGFKVVKGRQYSRYSNDTIFSKNETLLCLGEWFIKRESSKNNNISTYKNLVVGSKLNNNEGYIRVLELRKEKEEKDVIKVNNLYSWRTSGPVYAVLQYPEQNKIVYSSGNTLFTRSYNPTKKSIDPFVKNKVFGSLIIGISFKETNTLLVTTQSNSCFILKYDYTENIFKEIKMDKVTRNLFGGTSLNNDTLILSDRLNSSIYGIKIEGNEFKEVFQDVTGIVGRVKPCNFVPSWLFKHYTNIVLQSNRFLTIGINGEIVVFELLNENHKSFMERRTIPAWSGAGGKGMWKLEDCRLQKSNSGHNVFSDLKVLPDSFSYNFAL